MKSISIWVRLIYLRVGRLFPLAPYQTYPIEFGFWKTMKLLLSVREDFSVRWPEIRLRLSRIQSANFQWWQFGSSREPTRENTERLTVDGRVNVGRFLMIYKLIYVGWFTRHDSRWWNTDFSNPQFFEAIFFSIGGSKSRDSTVILAQASRFQTFLYIVSERSLTQNEDAFLTVRTLKPLTLEFIRSVLLGKD